MSDISFHSGYILKPSSLSLYTALPLESASFPLPEGPWGFPAASYPGTSFGYGLRG